MPPVDRVLIGLFHCTCGRPSPDDSSSPARPSSTSSVSFVEGDSPSKTAPASSSHSLTMVVPRSPRSRRRSDASGGGGVGSFRSRLNSAAGSPPNGLALPAGEPLHLGGGRGGLELRVDSYMSQGSWNSRGWAPGSREQSGFGAPPDLQLISPEDLIKVRFRCQQEGLSVLFWHVGRACRLTPG